MKTFELKVETFITFTPDEDKLRETFEERHEDLCNDECEAPEDFITKHPEECAAIEEFLAEEYCDEVYVGAGNGLSSGLLCAGSTDNGVGEFGSVYVEVSP
tara:strand:- start:456 stop:758 length:303 start_codon:yes stop_codon:yes gene_type:complete